LKLTKSDAMNTQKLFALSAILVLMALGVGMSWAQANVEDFEMGNLTQFAWETGGDARWFVTSTEKHSGTFSAQAGKIGDNGRSWLQVTLFVDEGQISFWYKTSSERRDQLIFSIDGEEKSKRSQLAEWEELSFSLRFGFHTFRWEYSKDSIGAEGQDTVWIDDITFPPIRPERLTSCPPTMPYAFCRLQPSHSGGVISVAFSPDGRLLASGSFDRTVKIWDVATGKGVRTLAGHTTLVNSVAFSPDGKLLASSGASEGTVRVWDLATGNLVRTFQTPNFFMVNVAFSPDGKWVVAASNSARTGVKFWNLATGNEVRTLLGVQYPIAFNPQNAYFAASSCGSLVGPGACVQGRITLFDAAGTAVRTLAGHTGTITMEGLAFSPDGKWLASGSCMLLPDPATPGCDYDETKLWEVATGKEVRTLRNKQSRTFGADSVAFSPDSRLLVSGLGPDTIVLWEVTTGSEVRTFRSPFGSRSVKFSPDGRLLAGGGFANPVLFYVGDLSK